MTEFYPLSERQERILAMVVHSYVESGKPVGSKTLVEDFGLDFSSATVRNDLALLGELGYVAQLHTSAGRIPTPRGYRIFVDTLLTIKPLDTEAERARREVQRDAVA